MDFANYSFGIVSLPQPIHAIVILTTKQLNIARISITPRLSPANKFKIPWPVHPTSHPAPQSTATPPS